MKKIAPLGLLLLLACGNSKVRKNHNGIDSLRTSQLVPMPDSIKISHQSPTFPAGNDDTTETGAAKNTQGENDVRYGGFRKTPACVRAMIEKFSKEEVANPPRKIYQYDYKGKIVFYVPALCCDFFSDLYDMDCNLIGHPDGGYTGRGDGSYPDFVKVRKHEKLVWEDERKR